jgi:hypothetical protein
LILIEPLIGPQPNDAPASTDALASVPDFDDSDDLTSMSKVMST